MRKAGESLFLYEIKSGKALDKRFLRAMRCFRTHYPNTMPDNESIVPNTVIYSGEDFHVFYPNKDEVYSVVVLYIIRDYKGKLKPFKDEVVELKWFDFDKLPKDINEKDIKMISDAISYYNKTSK